MRLNVLSLSVSDFRLFSLENLELLCCAVDQVENEEDADDYEEIEDAAGGDELVEGASIAK
jgi:hypothetical protein